MTRLFRAREGRWLGGVCQGIAPVRGLGVAWIRLAFVFAALCGGLGVVLYLACWLIIPAEGADAADHGPRGVVIFAQACACVAGLAVLAAAGVVATIFGFGWVVAGVAATKLAGALVWWRRLGPAWALLPIAALTLPAVAVAAAGLRLAPSIGTLIFDPGTTAPLRSQTFKSGLGTMLIDLRRTEFPPSGVVPLRIEAGLRRTIVALPHGTCVHVSVRYDVNPFAVRVAGLLTGRTQPEFSDVVLFGLLFGSGSGHVADTDRRVAGPLLMIDFSSQGGSLYVRDYPNTVDPKVQPDWPGYPVYPENRPDTKGVKPRAARALVRSWRRRRAVQLRSEQAIRSLMPGPCIPAPSPPRSAHTIRRRSK